MVELLLEVVGNIIQLGTRNIESIAFESSYHLSWRPLSNFYILIKLMIDGKNETWIMFKLTWSEIIIQTPNKFDFITRFIVIF